MLKAMATMKNPTSLMKLFLGTAKSWMRAIEPATTAVMNPAAPMSSPIARLPLLLLMAAKVEKTSGLPFPNARKVTPAMLSLKPRMPEMVLRLMQKNSLAATPIVVNRVAAHKMMMRNATGFAWPSRQ